MKFNPDKSGIHKAKFKIYNQENYVIESELEAKASLVDLKLIKIDEAVIEK